jgi:hypothetical protein
MDRDAYRERFGQHPASQALVGEALSLLGMKAARREALARAFQASGKSREEFADMYGLSPAEVAAL